MDEGRWGSSAFSPLALFDERQPRALCGLAFEPQSVVAHVDTRQPRALHMPTFEPYRLSLMLNETTVASCRDVKRRDAIIAYAMLGCMRMDE